MDKTKKPAAATAATSREQVAKTKERQTPAVSTAALMRGRPKGVVGTPRMEAASSTEQLMQQVQQELSRISSSVQQTADSALSEAKRNGELSNETKATADKALSQYHELSNSLSNLTGKLEALETRNLDLEQAVAGGANAPGQSVSIGHEVANSDALKSYRTSGQSSVTIKPQAAITSADGSGGGLIWDQQEREVVGMPRQVLSIRSLLNVVSTETDLIRYARQVRRQNNAAPTAQGARMPESSYGWSKAETSVKKLAHITHVADETLADASQMQGLIDGELRYGLQMEEEQQIMSGDGEGDNLNGLITQAEDFVAPGGLPNDTRIDRLRLGLLQIALGNYAANGITIHPVDWTAIELLKDTTGRYIFGNPNEQATPRLWGLNVIPTMSHAVGEWMAGNFFLAATLYDREDVEVLISSEHGENFVTGMKTMRATERVALAVKRRSALCTGDFTFANG